MELSTSVIDLSADTAYGLLDGRSAALLVARLEAERRAHEDAIERLRQEKAALARFVASTSGRSTPQRHSSPPLPPPLLRQQPAHAADEPAWARRVESALLRLEARLDAIEHFRPARLHRVSPGRDDGGSGGASDDSGTSTRAETSQRPALVIAVSEALAGFDAGLHGRIAALEAAMHSSAAATCAHVSNAVASALGPLASQIASVENRLASVASAIVNVELGLAGVESGVAASARETLAAVAAARLQAGAEAAETLAALRGLEPGSLAALDGARAAVRTLAIASELGGTVQGAAASLRAQVDARADAQAELARGLQAGADSRAAAVAGAFASRVVALAAQLEAHAAAQAERSSQLQATQAQLTEHFDKQLTERPGKGRIDGEGSELTLLARLHEKLDLHTATQAEHAAVARRLFERFERENCGGGGGAVSLDAFTTALSPLAAQLVSVESGVAASARETLAAVAAARLQAGAEAAATLEAVRGEAEATLAAVRGLECGPLSTSASAITEVVVEVLAVLRGSRSLASSRPLSTT